MSGLVAAAGLALPAVMPLLRDAAGRCVRVRGEAFTTFSVDGFRPIMVVNVHMVEAADR